MLKVYSRIGCAPCAQLKKYLDYTGIPYENTIEHQFSMVPTVQFPDGSLSQGWNTPVRIKINKFKEKLQAELSTA